MNNGYIKIFKVAAVARITCIAFLFLQEQLFHKDDGWNFTFPFWFYLLIFFVCIVIIFNTIASLFLSFRPSLLFQTFLKNRYLLVINYIIELIIVVLNAKQIFNDISWAFSPPAGSILNKIVQAVFNDSNSREYYKVEAIGEALFFLSDVIVLLLFWKIFAQRKKSVIIDADTMIDS